MYHSCEGSGKKGRVDPTKAGWQMPLTKVRIGKGLDLGCKKLFLPVSARSYILVLLYTPLGCVKAQ